GAAASPPIVPRAPPHARRAFARAASAHAATAAAQNKTRRYNKLRGEINRDARFGFRAQARLYLGNQAAGTRGRPSERGENECNCEFRNNRC
ncbi:hypothetical protein, partial [Lysobacter enzymogenes]|uniref:hypothetical protein n=1 Tax=Lysobacter enzymogenes TaxID=69 RepID=UPI0019D0A41C